MRKSTFCLALAFICVATALVLLTPSGSAQQVSGSELFQIVRPAFKKDRGPVIAIDEAHKNTHTYSSPPFAGLVKLLQADGYRVRPLAITISKESLKGIDVLILSGPGGWGNPGDSLTDDEVKALVAWIRAGGSLLFICDHMPAPLNGAKVAVALGITDWHDGYANVKLPDLPLVGPIIFWRSEYFPAAEPSVVPTGPGGWKGYQGTDAILAKHRITEGRDSTESVRRIATFVGSAFARPSGWDKLLTMPKQAISFAPPPTTGPLVFTKETPRVSVGGWLQGAVRKMAKGRVAAFGETGLFSAGPAADNRQFVLNVMHWLTRVI